MNDFGDLLGTPYAPVSKIAPVNRLNVLAPPGHDLVNFNKKYQLAPILVQIGFKTPEICSRIGF